MAAFARLSQRQFSCASIDRAERFFVFVLVGTDMLGREWTCHATLYSAEELPYVRVFGSRRYPLAAPLEGVDSP